MSDGTHVTGAARAFQFSFSPARRSQTRVFAATSLALHAVVGCRQLFSLTFTPLIVNSTRLTVCCLPTRQWSRRHTAQTNDNFRLLQTNAIHTRAALTRNRQRRDLTLSVVSQERTNTNGYRLIFVMSGAKTVLLAHRLPACVVNACGNKHSAIHSYRKL